MGAMETRTASTWPPVGASIGSARSRNLACPKPCAYDNGPPFASTGAGRLSRLSVWWPKPGIALERIEPAQATAERTSRALPPLLLDAPIEGSRPMVHQPLELVERPLCQGPRMAFASEGE